MDITDLDHLLAALTPDPDGFPVPSGVACLAQGYVVSTNRATIHAIREPGVTADTFIPISALRTARMLATTSVDFLPGLLVADGFTPVPYEPAALPMPYTDVWRVWNAVAAQEMTAVHFDPTPFREAAERGVLKVMVGPMGMVVDGTTIGGGFTITGAVGFRPCYAARLSPGVLFVPTKPYSEGGLALYQSDNNRVTMVATHAK